MNKILDLQNHIAMISGAGQGYGKKGITVNNVAIGAVETDALAGIMAQPERFAKMVRVYPIGRIGQPEEVANMVLFLSSSAGEWITGQTYPVNGGYSTAM